MCVDY
jgi:hypothetical protein